MTVPPAPTERPADPIPGLTACSLCAGETLGDLDSLPGGQLERLRRLEARGVTRLALSECLDECNRGDVVVARPSTAGRARGARPVWFQQLAGDDATGALAAWLDGGGPGLAPLPDELAPRVIDRGVTSRLPAGS